MSGVQPNEVSRLLYARDVLASGGGVLQQQCGHLVAVAPNLCFKILNKIGCRLVCLSALLLQLHELSKRGVVPLPELPKLLRSG